MANNRVTKEKRAFIIMALCEGMAINSVCRTFKVGIHAVMRIIEETGEACEDWHNRHFRDLNVARLELDEQWAYVHTHKERMSREVRMQNPERGDCWLWASIDPESKAIINWRTGKRTKAAAQHFAKDLAARVPGRVQITSDQLQGYPFAIRGTFGDRADYAQEHKIFQAVKVDGPHWMKMRVNPLVGVDRKAICGNPSTEAAKGGRRQHDRSPLKLSAASLVRVATINVLVFMNRTEYQTRFVQHMMNLNVCRYIANDQRQARAAQGVNDTRD